MPYICGGYTKEDWGILNGSHIDIEFLDDLWDDPLYRHEIEMNMAKPKWLKC